jgi:hypothetical protein
MFLFAEVACYFTCLHTEAVQKYRLVQSVCRRIAASSETSFGAEAADVQNRVLQEFDVSLKERQKAVERISVHFETKKILPIF